MINFFEINTDTYINLYAIEAISIITDRATQKDKIIAIASGREYLIDESRSPAFLSMLKIVEKGSTLSSQYTAV